MIHRFVWWYFAGMIGACYVTFIVVVLMMIQNHG